MKRLLIFFAFISINSYGQDTMLCVGNNWTEDEANLMIKSFARQWDDVDSRERRAQRIKQGIVEGMQFNKMPQMIGVFNPVIHSKRTMNGYTVENTRSMGHNDHLYERAHSAFFDYTENVSQSKPIEGIPIVKGEGTMTIKNGTVGVLSWGIQSTAQNVGIILDNVKIVTSGINSTAVDVPHATITKSTFDVNNPFIINRHGSEFYGVDLRGNRASEVSYSEFYGGQLLDMEGYLEKLKKYRRSFELEF